MQKRELITNELLKSGVVMECKNCKGTKFVPMVQVTFVSGLNPQNPAGQDIIGSVPTGMYCITCMSESVPSVPEPKKIKKAKVVN